MQLRDMIEAKRRLDEEIGCGRTDARDSMLWFSKVLGEAIVKIEFTENVFGIAFDALVIPRKPAASTRIIMAKAKAV